MHMKTFLTLIILIGGTATSFSQSKFAIGVQGGLARLDAKTLSSPNQLDILKAHGTADIDILIYGKYTFAPKWSARLGLGAVKLSPSSRIAGDNLGNSIFLGTSDFGFGKPNFQITGSLDRDIPFGTSDWGGILSLGLGVIRSGFERTYDLELESEDGIQFGYSSRTANGEVSELLAHDMRYQINDQKMLYHLRPEVGFYKNFGQHKVLATLLYAFNLRQPLIEIDYNSISYFKEFYSAQYQFSGSFASLKLGYEYSF